MLLKTNLQSASQQYMYSTVFPGFLWYTKFNYRIYTNKIYCKKIFTNVFKFFTSFATRTCNKIKFNFRYVQKSKVVCVHNIYTVKKHFFGLFSLIYHEGFRNSSFTLQTNGKKRLDRLSFWQILGTDKINRTIALILRIK